MEQDGTAKRNIELANSFRRYIVDIDILLDHIRAKYPLRDIERLVEISMGRLGCLIRLIIWAKVMVKPFREICRGNTSTTSLKLEREKATCRTNINYTLTGKLVWKSIAM